LCISIHYRRLIELFPKYNPNFTFRIYLYIMKLENFKLIVITHEKYIAGEAVSINGLFEAGLQFLHIRKPSYHTEGIKNLLGFISKDFHPKIVLHGHYELLESFNLKGAHLPEKTRKGGKTEDIKTIVSTSFHKLEDIKSEQINFEYVFFSPVFQSISKKGYKPSDRLQKVKDYLQSDKKPTHPPVIALGGITNENISQLKDIGFSGAASLGYIWENPNPLDQFNKLQRIVQG
jgi:thiamine-phosphate pyrophosphorylase